MKLSLDLSNILKKKNKENKRKLDTQVEQSSFDDKIEDPVENSDSSFNVVKKQKEQLFLIISFIFFVISFFLISGGIYNTNNNSYNLSKILNDKNTLADSFRNLNLYKKRIINYAKENNIKINKNIDKNMNNLAINYLFSLPLHALKNNIIINSVYINKRQISNLKAVNGINFNPIGSRKYIGLKEINFVISGKYNSLQGLDKFTKFYKNASLVGVNLNKNNFKISEVIYGN